MSDPTLTIPIRSRTSEAMERATGIIWDTGYARGRNESATEIAQLKQLVTRLTDKLADLDRDVPGIAHPDLSAAIFCGRNLIHG